MAYRASYGSSIGFSLNALTHGFRARPSEGDFVELEQIADPEHRQWSCVAICVISSSGLSRFSFASAV